MQLFGGFPCLSRVLTSLFDIPKFFSVLFQYVSPLVPSNNGEPPFFQLSLVNASSPDKLTGPSVWSRLPIRSSTFEQASSQPSRSLLLGIHCACYFHSWPKGIVPSSLPTPKLSLNIFLKKDPGLFFFFFLTFSEFS
jgi:hypothetical protein